jgi:lipopolysaccharide transport system ATP-binding protein
LTGRENIFLNGAVLGMQRADIRRKFDEIVAFAEIEQFLDTPVKRYSSGMYVRLAFAVAAHLDPEILIIDEVLAVGDASFQKKCMGKMDDVSRGGRTVLFVSHNMAAVQRLCQKGIYLEKGHVLAAGNVEEVIERYLRQGENVVTKSHTFSNVQQDASKKAEAIEIYFGDAAGTPAPYVYIDQPFSITIDWRLNAAVPHMRLGVDIIDSSGVVVLSTMDTDTTDLHAKPRSPGRRKESVHFPPMLLMPGRYSVRVFAGIPMVERLILLDDVIRFDIVDRDSHLSHLTGARRGGYIAMPLEWRVGSS